MERHFPEKTAQVRFLSARLMAAGSRAWRLVFGIHLACALFPMAGSSPSTTIRIRVRHAGWCTSFGAATMVFGFSTDGQVLIRCRLGTENCRALCRWSGELVKRRPRSCLLPVHFG